MKSPSPRLVPYKNQLINTVLQSLGKPSSDFLTKNELRFHESSIIVLHRSSNYFARGLFKLAQAGFSRQDIFTNPIMDYTNSCLIRLARTDEAIGVFYPAQKVVEVAFQGSEILISSQNCLMFGGEACDLNNLPPQVSELAGFGSDVLLLTEYDNSFSDYFCKCGWNVFFFRMEIKQDRGFAILVRSQDLLPLNGIEFRLVAEMCVGYYPSWSGNLRFLPQDYSNPTIHYFAIGNFNVSNLPTKQTAIGTGHMCASNSILRRLMHISRIVETKQDPLVLADFNPYGLSTSHWFFGFLPMILGGKLPAGAWWFVVHGIVSKLFPKQDLNLREMKLWQALLATKTNNLVELFYPTTRTGQKKPTLLMPLFNLTLDLALVPKHIKLARSVCKSYPRFDHKRLTFWVKSNRKPR